MEGSDDNIPHSMTRRKRLPRQRKSAPPSVQPPPWTLKDLGQMLVLIAVLFVGVIGLTMYGFGDNGPWIGWPEGTQTGFLYLLQTVILLLPLYLFTHIKYKSSPHHFGLRKVPIRTLALRVFQGIVLYYIVATLLAEFEQSTQVEIPGVGEQESHVPLFGETAQGLWLGGILLAVLAPLVEELFFRGYVYQVFKKSVTVGWASVLSAGVFALFHFEFTVFVPLFLLGLILNWLFESTRSLWVPIAFHMANNAFAFLIEIAVFKEWIEIPT